MGVPEERPPIQSSLLLFPKTRQHHPKTTSKDNRADREVEAEYVEAEYEEAVMHHGIPTPRFKNPLFSITWSIQNDWVWRVQLPFTSFTKIPSLTLLHFVDLEFSDTKIFIILLETRVRFIGFPIPFPCFSKLGHILQHPFQTYSIQITLTAT